MGVLFLGACEPSFPFNVAMLPFLPTDSRDGVHRPNLAPLSVEVLAIVVPEFTLDQISLNAVQIPFSAGPAIGNENIVSAVVELGFNMEILPADTGMAAQIETEISLFLAPGTAANRFDAIYRIYLGPAQFGLSSEASLVGELSAAQVEFLKSGSLLLGMELDQTYVSLTNGGEQTYSFEGIRWELTALRIRGSALLPS